jgi:hypothetical protein
MRGVKYLVDLAYTPGSLHHKLSSLSGLVPARGSSPKEIEPEVDPPAEEGHKRKALLIPIAGSNLPFIKFITLYAGH